MKFIMKYIGILLLALALFSCVPQKQFSDLQSKTKRFEDSNLLLKEENRELTVELTELEGKFEALLKKFQQLENKTQNQGGVYTDLKRNYERLEKKYNDLENQNSVLKAGSSEEITKLLKELQLLQEDLQEREDRVKLASVKLAEQETTLEKAQEELSQQEELLANANKTLAEQQARLSELQAALDNQKQSVSMLKEKLNKALRGFYDQGLSVYEKNGKVYVSLEEQLMFKTGSYSLGTQGQKAIQSLAEVLANNQDINVMVEGHTDNVPLNGTNQIKDNWDLSVMRATAVCKIILENTGIAPSRITAAGRGEFVPLDTADTPEARQKNRRTEIILTPNLNEVLQMLE